MIVTLTPNPSVDRTIAVASLRRGEVLRATASRIDAGGKGVNVSRALAAHGLPTVAVLPSGGAEGAQLRALLIRQGVEVVEVPISGSLRANISVVEPDGTVTKLNEQGPTLGPDEVEALLAATLLAARGGSAATEWVVAAGSLPPGTDPGLFAHLVGVLRGAGVRLAVDSSGVPLELALPARPDLVKPNREELAQVTRMPVSTVGEALSAAQTLLDRGAGAVLASLGVDGALLVQSDGTWYGEAPVDAPSSAVGAGDAALAGFLAGGGRGPTALAEALAWGAAAVRLPGSRMPGRGDLDRATVRLSDAVPLDRNLKGP